MTLKVVIKESKEVALWCEYKDEDGKVLAEFKVRGDDYQAYKVAVERANNQVASNGYNVAEASSDNKLYHELLLQAAACHLIEDWKGVEFDIDGEITSVPFTPENATKLFNMGDIGPAIWWFVKSQASEIQANANKVESDILGKSENSIGGSDLVVKKKQASTTKNSKR